MRHGKVYIKKSRPELYLEQAPKRLFFTDPLDNLSVGQILYQLFRTHRLAILPTGRGDPI